MEVSFEDFSGDDTERTSDEDGDGDGGWEIGGESDFIEGQLPAFTPVRQVDDRMIVWGEKSFGEMRRVVVEAYEEVATTFRKNLFKLPKGQQGKRYVVEKNRLLRQFTDAGPLQAIALTAEKLMDHLLRQRTTTENVAAKVNKDNLRRRLELWEAGEIGKLLEEARVLQSRMVERRRMTPERLARTVANMTFEGKIKEACMLLEREGTAHKGGVLPLEQEVVDKLRSKHPEAAEWDVEEVMPGPPPVMHPAVFDSLTVDVVKKAFLQTRGAAGVSGADADHYRLVVTAYKGASANLLETLALKARMLCTQYLDPASLQAYLNNRLIPLDKSPGVRPVGIGEVERRGIGKAVLSVLKKEVIDAASVDQMCTGQPAACEAVVHAMKRCFEAEAADGLLLVDADNAFNRLKREVALLNIRHLCPPLGVILINCYRSPANLYVSGGLVLISQEGVTQGDPLSMVMYGLALLPLIRELSGCNGSTQSWYADDGQAVGGFAALRQWWDVLVERGPAFGYYPQAAKTWLVVKGGEEAMARAAEAFEGTGVQIARDGGSRDLGAAVGSEDFKRRYVGSKVAEWAEQVACLAEVAKVQPHAAHALLVHGLKHRWTYMQRCMGYVEGAFGPLEEVLRTKFIPALFGDGELVSDLAREIYALPSRLGGLAIDDPAGDARYKYRDSLALTARIQEAILQGGGGIDVEEISDARRAIQSAREREVRERAEVVKGQLEVGSPLRKALEVASEKGASGVFTVRPLARHGFCFPSKRDFRDLLALRYAKQVPGLPATCACGSVNSVSHSQQCLLGGFIVHRHNEFERLWAVECKKVFNDVELEPQLQPLEGEVFEYRSAVVADDARSDVRVRGFWGNWRNALFDFAVFYPFASSYFSKSLASTYRARSRAKKREYGERANEVEDSSFTPMVMSSAGGMGGEMEQAVKFLAARIADQEGVAYSQAVGVLRARFSFVAARTTLVCLRGSRVLSRSRRFGRGVGERDAPIALVAAEM